MIQVRIERRASDRYIESVYVDGHAGYAKRGEDIVCAGISAVTVGTVNAVKGLLDVELDHRMVHGLLHMSVPKVLDEADEEKREHIQLLLESMVVMLETIKVTYGKYIAIQEKFI